MPIGSSATQISDALREAIQNGSLELGAALRQDELAVQFGVSRIPVREALQKLEAEGLLTIHPNRSAYVKMPTVEEVGELFDLRVLLEGDLLRRAIPFHTPRTIRRIEAIQEELDVEDEARQWLELDQRFHFELYAPSMRPLTLAHIKGLRAMVNRFYFAMLSPSTGRDAWSQEHRAILDSVAAGDADQACAALTDHLRRSADLTISHMKTVQERQ